MFRPPFKTWLALCLLWLSGILSTGCTIGPRLITASRANYNNAVQVTAREEMLLNIVRTKYGDPPEFLAIGNITTQFELGSTFGIGREFGLGDARLSGTVNTADRPTVTLTPLQDEQFTKRFLSPIGLDTIYLFSRNGQRVERLLRLTVENVNGVSNSPEVFRPDAAMSVNAFSVAVRTLGDLARQHQIEIAHEETIEKVSQPLAENDVKGADVVAALEKGYHFQPSDQEKTVVLTAKRQNETLRVSPDAFGSPELAATLDILNLVSGQASYPMKLALEGQLKTPRQLGPTKELIVSTRSVEEILHFLSRGVAVPTPHIECGLVTGPSGVPVDYIGIDDLLHVRCSKHRPKCAALAVSFRGYWFYLDDSDSESKETFELLLELYNLEIRGGGGAAMPVLTLPVGR